MRQAESEWLDATVVEDREQSPTSPPEPSVFDDVTEISAGLQTMALAQAETGVVLIVEDPAEVPDPAEDDEPLPVLDPAEFDGIESLAISMREPPILRKLRLLLLSLPHADAIRRRIARSRLPRLFAPLLATLRALWSSPKSSAARARLASLIASVGTAVAAVRTAVGALRSRIEPATTAARDAIRSKMPRVFEISGTALDALRSALPSSNKPPTTDDPDALSLLTEQHKRQRVATIAVCAAVALGAWALGSRLLGFFA